MKLSTNQKRISLPISCPVLGLCGQILDHEHSVTHQGFAEPKAAHLSSPLGPSCGQGHFLDGTKCDLEGSIYRALRRTSL